MPGNYWEIGEMEIEVIERLLAEKLKEQENK